MLLFLPCLEQLHGKSLRRRCNTFSENVENLGVTWVRDEEGDSQLTEGAEVSLMERAT